MHFNRHESERSPNPAIYCAVAALAVAALGCRWSAKVEPWRAGLAVNGSGRSTNGVEAWVGLGDIALDVSAAHRTYGVLVRAEIIKSGMPNQILWEQEIGINNPSAAPNPAGPYSRDLR